MGNAHEASASATGYLYQCRYALLMGLEATLDSPELRISIEKFDDIAFEMNGQPVHLVQTKHHEAITGKQTEAERKSQLRTFNTLMVPGRKAVEFRIENVGFISGIHDDDPHFKHYLDPYMQPGLRSHLHLFSGGQNKLMAGLSGRP